MSFRRRWAVLVPVLLVSTSVLAGGAAPTRAESRGAAAASATAVTFQAIADTRVHEAAPTANYGTRVVLRVEGGSDPDIESYLRFAVSGLAGTVQRATLRLYATAGTVDGPAAFGTTADWVETAMNWNSRPGPTTAAVDDAGAVGTGSWLELDVTPLVAGNGTVSFLVAATSTDAADFHSREASATTLRPELVVEMLASGPPVALSPPTISGSPQEGGTLTASPGTWSGSQPIDLAYQWQRCDASATGCTDVDGEDGETYVVGQMDVGTRLRVVVTATNGEGEETAASAPTGLVIGAGDVVIAAAGDIAVCGSSVDEATAGLVDSIAPDRVLTLGDHVYPDGAPAEYASCYEPSWGRHKAKTQPTPGNHDYHTPGAAGYFGYFGAAAGDPAKGYYAFDLGAWRLYALNSNCTQVSCAPGSAQEQWLRSDLAENPRSCIAAFTHHPRFASGVGSQRGDNVELAPLFQAFYEASGDLWLSGHNHNYERLTRLTPSGSIDLVRGVRVFVAGTGGAALYDFLTPNTGSEARGKAHGVLKLALRDGGYDWQFAPLPGTTFTDSGRDTCGSAPADTTEPSTPGGLVASSSAAGDVVLAWTASSDDLGVVAYDVYRDGQLLGSTTETGYTDTTAPAGETYAYFVTAKDAAGNESAPSETLSVTVQVPPASTVSFAAEADARVLEAKPTSNFGSSSVLRVDGGSDPDMESYLRFTVAGLPGPVGRATLRLYATAATVDGPAAYGTDPGWAEKGITWNARPAVTTAAVDDEGPIAAATWVEYDVTSIVSAEGTFSFRLATTSRDNVDFYSRESSQTARRPQLVVAYG